MIKAVLRMIMITGENKNYPDKSESVPKKMYRREKKLIFCKNRERKQRKIAVNTENKSILV